MLSVKRPGPQTPSDDGLVSPDGGLDQRPFAVAGGSLPLHPAVSADCRDMAIPLTGRLLAGRFDRVGARRNDDYSIGAVIDDGVVNRCSVIGAVGGVRSDDGSGRTMVPPARRR
jgi:hypothetical protein